MCGIFFCLNAKRNTVLDQKTKSLLSHRGPDSFRQHDVVVDGVSLTFVSTVLSLRSHHVVSQPLIDERGSVLCWNGEAWSFADEEGDITGNDTDAVFKKLHGASSHEEVLSVFSAIRGPFACVYYHSTQRRVYFGRDCLGRRSLVTATTQCGEKIIASIPTDPALQWSEVDAEGIFYIDLDESAWISNLAPFTVENKPPPTSMVCCSLSKSIFRSFTLTTKVFSISRSKHDHSRASTRTNIRD